MTVLDRRGARNILIFSEDFPPGSGGIAQWAAGVGSSLHRLGHRVRVLTRYHPEHAGVSPRSWDFPIDYVPGNRWKQLRTLYAYRSVRKLQQDGYRPHMIIATTWNIARGVVSFARTTRAKLVIVVHGLEVTRRMWILKKLWLRKTLNSSDVVVAVSGFTRSHVLKHYRVNPRKVHVLPNGVDVSAFYPKADTTSLRQDLGLKDERIILTLARIIERKGHEQVI